MTGGALIVLAAMAATSLLSLAWSARWRLKKVAIAIRVWKIDAFIEFYEDRRR